MVRPSLASSEAHFVEEKHCRAVSESKSGSWQDHAPRHVDTVVSEPETFMLPSSSRPPPGIPIQEHQSLFRSNSAHAYTVPGPTHGVPDSPDIMFPGASSVSPRSHTVFDRSAARKTGSLSYAKGIESPVAATLTKRKLAPNPAAKPCQPQPTDKSGALSIPTYPWLSSRPSISLPCPEPPISSPIELALQTETHNAAIHDTPWKRRCTDVERDHDPAVSARSISHGLHATHNCSPRWPSRGHPIRSSLTLGSVPSVPTILSPSSSAPGSFLPVPPSPPRTEVTSTLRDECYGMEPERLGRDGFPSEHLRSPFHSRLIHLFADPGPNHVQVEDDDDCVRRRLPRGGFNSRSEVSLSHVYLAADVPSIKRSRSLSLRDYPRRLSISTTNQSDRSLLAEFDGQDSLAVSEVPPKQGTGIGAWRKFLEAFTKNGWNRSRRDGMAAKEPKQMTSFGPDKGRRRSLASPQVNTNEHAPAYPTSSLRSLPASRSEPSLDMSTSPMGGFSPIPAYSDLNLTRYQRDDKLFPFPGLKKLEEERNKNRNRRALSVSSAPDTVLPVYGRKNKSKTRSSSPIVTSSPQLSRERDLASQVSNKCEVLNFPTPSTTPSSPYRDPSSGQIPPFPGLEMLRTRHVNSRARRGLSMPSLLPMESSSVPESDGQYANNHPSNSVLDPLPTDLVGVRKWLRDRYGSSKQVSTGSSPSTPTSGTICPTVLSEKPSLSDILKWNEDELILDLEDVGFCEGKPIVLRKAAQETRREEEDAHAMISIDLSMLVTRDGEFPVAAGGCADIYKGTFFRVNRTAIKVAIKAIKVYSADPEDNYPRKIRRLRREIKVWMKLKHSNILPLLGTTSGFGPFPAMVCPWLANGTLTSYLGRFANNLSIQQILALIRDVASGLQYLHSQYIVHGDLSGSNVLIGSKGKAYLSDFGLSTILGEIGGSTFTTSSTGKPRGTLRWAAPELLDLVDAGDANVRHTGPTTRSDVYSFGGIMLQILSGKVPYHYYPRDAQIIAAIFREERPTRPDNPRVTDRRWKFIQRCWSPFRDVSLRPSGEEIVAFSMNDLAKYLVLYGDEC